MRTADKALESPKQINDRPDSKLEPMDQKENFCLAQGENSSMSIQTKRIRKGRESNLRKSLAWNQAFFTEEGVLDPIELSCLSKTSSKSVGNSSLLDEISPLKSYLKSSVNITTSSLCKYSKPRKLFQSSIIESEAQMIGGKTISSKGTLKSIPRSPSTNLQKRFGTTTSNLASKVPKFTKLPSASKTSDNPMLPICSSKIDKSAIKVHAGQNPTLRPPAAKEDFACSSLSPNFSAAVHRKSLGKNNGVNLKEGSNIFPPAVHDSITRGPTKQGAKSLSQIINNIPRVPVASHARPSALRMPSPSLGFFCQGKASTSYNNQSQRPLQESKPLPITQPNNLKQKNELQPQPTSFGQLSTEAITAEQSSCSIPSSPHNTRVHVKTNSELKAIITDRNTINSTSPHSEKDSSPLKSSNDYSIQEEKDISNSIPRNVYCAPAKDSDKTSCSMESQIVCDNMMDVQVYTPEITSDAPIEVFNMNDASCLHESQLGSNLNEAGGETCPNASEHSLTDDYLDCSSDVVLGIAHEIGLNFSTETKLSFEEEIRGNDSPNNEELGGSVLPSSETYDEIAKNCTLVEKNGSEFEEMEICDLHSDSTGANSSLSEKSDTDFDKIEIQDSNCNSTCMNGSTREMMSIDVSKQDRLLNVAPFSDEWIAALEAYGEEILVKKTGAVQNSPPNKSSPERSPWSPVKKKVQEVGPFDCTKYTKNLASSYTD